MIEIKHTSTPPGKQDKHREPCKVRRATLLDLDAILSIESISFSSPWPRSAFMAEIKAHSWSNVFVAEQEGTIVGFMVYWSAVGELHLLNLAVRPEIRKQGIGSFMVETLIETATKQGNHEILLEARESNYSARRLYEGFGFENLAKRQGYYTDNGEDAIVMGLLLEDLREG